MSGLNAPYKNTDTIIKHISNVKHQESSMIPMYTSLSGTAAAVASPHFPHKHYYHHRRRHSFVRSFPGLVIVIKKEEVLI